MNSLRQDGHNIKCLRCPACLDWTDISQAQTLYSLKVGDTRKSYPLCARCNFIAGNDPEFFHFLLAHYIKALVADMSDEEVMEAFHEKKAEWMDEGLLQKDVEW